MLNLRYDPNVVVTIYGDSTHIRVDATTRRYEEIFEVFDPTTLQFIRQPLVGQVNWPLDVDVMDHGSSSCQGIPWDTYLTVQQKN